MDENLYAGREQSWVKHKILERYLLRLALIIGQTPGMNSLTYVDCFSGPWKSKSEDFEDTSFAIAIQQLRAAKTKLWEMGHEIQLRAFFIERNRKPFAELQRYVLEIDDIEIEIRNQTLEESIGEICEFVRAARRKTFPFLFIDPKGWSGFALDTIRPLFDLKPCELLINFMTQDIIRFINNDESHESFRRLFGSEDFREELAGTKKENRVDKSVFHYRNAVSKAGKFPYPGVAGILNPLKARSHFHLIYLSRHPKGLEVFKAVEKASMEDMERSRAKLEQSAREERTKQKELFGFEEAPESMYFQELRERYRRMASTSSLSVLSECRRVSYDEIWKIWMRFPMVWESDLKEWVKESREITVEGLTKRQRVPKRGQNHFIVRDVDD